MNAKYITYILSIKPKCKLITTNAFLVRIHGALTTKKMVEPMWCVVDLTAVYLDNFHHSSSKLEQQQTHSAAESILPYSEYN
jgi:hypothetical protein